VLLGVALPLLMTTLHGNHAGFRDLSASLLFRVVSRGKKTVENLNEDINKGWNSLVEKI